MLQSFSVALFLYSKNKSYGKLVTLAQAVHDGLIAQSVLFPSPVPNPTTLASQITAVLNAQALWNDGAGSKSALSTLRGAAKTLRASLKQLAEYVMTTAPDNTQAWINVGFEVKAGPSASVPFNKVENFRQLLRATNLPQGSIKLKWKRPLNAVGKKVSAYKVLRGTTPDSAQAEEIALITRTTYIDTPPAGQISYYFVIPFNAAGPGATSDVLMVSMPA